MMMRMADAWVRGTHPGCGWIRLILLPLMLVPMWFGSMLGGMLIMTAWMMLPLLVRKPSSGDGWITRACLGVQIWRSRPLDDPVSLLLVALAGVFLLLAAALAGRQDPVSMAVCVPAYFATYLSFLSRCAKNLAARAKRQLV